MGNVHLRRINAAVLVAVALSSCSDDTDKPDKASGAGSSVEVLDAGSAPRATLRIHPNVGAEQAVTLRQTQQQRMTIGGQTQELKAPATEVDLRYRVTSTSGGRIVTDVAYEKTRVGAGYRSCGCHANERGARGV